MCCVATPRSAVRVVNVEVVNRISWRTIPNLRKQAAHLAARWGVPFEDKLVGDKLGDK